MFKTNNAINKMLGKKIKRDCYSKNKKLHNEIYNGDKLTIISEGYKDMVVYNLYIDGEKKESWIINSSDDPKQKLEKLIIEGRHIVNKKWGITGRKNRDKYETEWRRKWYT